MSQVSWAPPQRRSMALGDGICIGRAISGQKARVVIVPRRGEQLRAEGPRCKSLGRSPGTRGIPVCGLKTRAMCIAHRRFAHRLTSPPKSVAFGNDNAGLQPASDAGPDTWGYAPGFYNSRLQRDERSNRIPGASSQAVMTRAFSAMLADEMSISAMRLQPPR